jgi:hypothetical protein
MVWKILGTSANGGGGVEEESEPEADKERGLVGSEGL